VAEEPSGVYPPVVLLALYIGLFVLLSVWGIHTETEIGAPRWKVGLGAVAGAVGAAGMIFYWRDAVTPGLSSAWKLVFPLLVLQSIVDAAWDLRYGLERVDPDGEAGVAARRGLVIASFATGILVLVPYFYINYRVAFG
jgi:hypothetical protein